MATIYILTGITTTTTPSMGGTCSGPEVDTSDNYNAYVYNEFGNPTTAPITINFDITGVTTPSGSFTTSLIIPSGSTSGSTSVIVSAFDDVCSSPGNCVCQVTASVSYFELTTSDPEYTIIVTNEFPTPTPTTTTTPTPTPTLECDCVQYVNVEVTSAGTITYLDCNGVGQSQNVGIGPEVIGVATCINKNTLEGTASFTIDSIGPCCNGVTPTPTTTSTPTQTPTTTSTPTQTPSTCDCVQFVNVEVTTAGIITYLDCDGISQFQNVSIGPEVIGVATCINKNTLGGTAIFTIDNIGPCCNVVTPTPTSTSGSVTPTPTPTSTSGSVTPTPTPTSGGITCIQIVDTVINPVPQTGVNNFFGVNVALNPYPVSENLTVTGYIRDDGNISNTYNFSITIIGGTQSGETANNVLMTGPADTATIFVTGVTPTTVTYNSNSVYICGFEPAQTPTPTQTPTQTPTNLPPTNNIFIGRIAYNNGTKVDSALNTDNISLAVNNSVDFSTLNWCASCGVCNEYTIITDSYFMGKTTLENVRAMCYCTNSTDLNVLLSSINKIAATKFEGPFADLQSAMTWIKDNGLFITNQNYPPIVTDGNVLHLDGGLPASYPLVGTSWYDLTENSNNGVLINGVTYNSSVKGYLAFNGSNQYVSVSGNTNIPVGNSNYTIGVWFNADTLGDKGLVGWGNYGTTNEVNAFRLTSNGLTNYWWANDLSVTTTITPGNWYYAVATFDGTTRSIYINGSLVGSDTPTGHNVTTSSNLTIGVTNSTEYFDGSIGDVQIFDRAITPTEILQNYNSFVTRYDGTNTEICLTPVYCDATLTFVSYDDTSGATFNLSAPVGGVITIDGDTGFGPGWRVFKYDDLGCDNLVGSVDAENSISWAIGESGNKSILGTQTGLTGTRYKKGNQIRVDFTPYINGSTFEVAGTTVTVFINTDCETLLVPPTPTPTATPTPTPFSEFFSATTCNTQINSNSWVGSGGRGIFTVTVDVGTGTGTTNLNFDAYSIPDKWVVTWDGNTVIDTGFRGNSIYNSELNALGYPNVSGPASGNISFNKTSSLPSVVTIVITAPLVGTAWEATLGCPANPPTPTPTTTTTPTNTPTVTPTRPCNTIFTHGAIRFTCGDYCNTNYLIQTTDCASEPYGALSIGDFIYGYAGQSGYLAYSNVSTDTATGPFRIADIDGTGEILGIYVCNAGSCIPL
jgi:hypothetical protein